MFYSYPIKNASRRAVGPQYCLLFARYELGRQAQMGRWHPDIINKRIEMFILVLTNFNFKVTFLNFKLMFEKGHFRHLNSFHSNVLTISFCYRVILGTWPSAVRKKMAECWSENVEEDQLLERMLQNGLPNWVEKVNKFVLFIMFCLIFVFLSVVMSQISYLFWAYAIYL